MAKFCTYCGKPLPENGVCDCPESAAARPAAPVEPAPQPAPQPAVPLSENAYVKKTREAVSQSVPFVKDYWKDTMDATRHVLQNQNMGLAVVMMVINALVTGLLLFCTFSKLGSALRSASKKMFGGKVDVEIPFLSSLLLGMVMALVALALSALVVFVVLKALRINAGFGHVVMAVGVNSIPCTLCLVLALLMVLAGWTTGVLIFLLLGMVTWVVMGAMVLVRVFNTPVSSMMQLCCCVLFAAVLVLNIWIGGKLALTAAGKIEIDDEELSDTIEEIGDYLEDIDLEDLILQY